MKLIAVTILLSTVAALWVFQWEYIQDGDFRVNRFTGEIQALSIRDRDRPTDDFKYRGVN